MTAANVFVLGTHLFAAPAIWRAPSAALRGQILIAAAVSVAYHALHNDASGNTPEFLDTLDTLQRLDHATSTALIATVLLQEVTAVRGLVSFVVLVAGLAASALRVGNLVGVGVAVVAACLAWAGAQQTPGVGRGCLRHAVTALTLGGQPADVVLLWDRYLSLAVVFQVLSATFYGVGEWAPTPDGVGARPWTRWWHGAWHACAFLALYMLVEHLRQRPKLSPRRTGTALLTRAPRAEYTAWRRGAPRAAGGAPRA